METLKVDIRGWKVDRQNPSPYVIRLLPLVELFPGDQTLSLPKTYILPGQTLNLDLPKDQRAVATRVTIKPANLHGYAAEPFSAPIE
ncbi:hypothetical protein K2E95_14385 [Pseudomonas sp. ERGC3:01]|nr:hypothetical protein [Pseudomonas sp. ERGC3:01]